MRKRLQALIAHFRAPEPVATISSALQQSAEAIRADRIRQSEEIEAQRTIRRLEAELLANRTAEQQHRADYIERSCELIEARQMAGTGPWLVHEARASVAAGGTVLRETTPITSQGAYGDIELALQNVEWRREINLSWLEFSRWGIQQIILIARLYYIKNPIIRRLIDVCAAYVFARGVECISTDDVGTEVLEEFFERNKSVLGHIALVDLERRKDYDGNLFFCFFADRENSGKVTVRTIDATEMMDVITNPEDTDEPWYYRRCWTERIFNDSTGEVKTGSREAWYPAISYDPPSKPPSMGNIPVMWNNPVLHRKCGGIAKWHFGCPRIYPAIDWSKAAKRFLEACATVKQALAQIGMTLTTKGGQQALEGAKQQLMTTVGPSSALWDTNPTAVNGSIFASGPGTTLEAFATRGAGADPEEVRQFKLMCCMVKGVPETFLADVSTGNLATATSLDRPTETAILELQESWIEDLNTIGRYVLQISYGATSGMLRESKSKAVLPLKIQEGRRITLANGRRAYEAKEPEEGVIEVRTNFPSIREGDAGVLIHATCEAMAAGIDPKVGVTQLYDLLPGVENGVDIANEQYPEGSYKPAENTKEKKAEQQQKAMAAAKPVRPSEAATRRLAGQLIDAVEAEKNSTVSNPDYWPVEGDKNGSQHIQSR